MQPAAPIRHGPLWTRAFHAFNLVVLLLMAASGLQIYNANPVFGGRGGATVPELFTLGGWLAGGRDWHFGVMGLYGANLRCLDRSAAPPAAPAPGGPGRFRNPSRQQQHPEAAPGRPPAGVHPDADRARLQPDHRDGDV